ncbi:hypothetical protein BT96DRAFT_949178 [Gymnopus androsaceus JB14]|uniref:Uncharacterized protein n=1 Tax=Gymnopus androsaceus JB14 TaxID=1447944 RepID=A0A6A4GKU8_9AGAR|nr:hypothetical protein BT96DRAFT_949178 [Gymnopus androsaceus JB14]
MFWRLSLVVICPWWEIGGSAVNFTIHNISAALDYDERLAIIVPHICARFFRTRFDSLFFLNYYLPICARQAVGVQFERRVNLFLYLHLCELEDVLASVPGISRCVICPWWEIGGSAANFTIHNLSAALSCGNWEATLPPSIHSNSPTQVEACGLPGRDLSSPAVPPYAEDRTQISGWSPSFIGSRTKDRDTNENDCYMADVYLVPNITPVGETFALSSTLANSSPVLPILSENILVLASAMSQKTVHFTKLSYQLFQSHVIFGHFSSSRWDRIVCSDIQCVLMVLLISEDFNPSELPSQKLHHCFQSTASFNACKMSSQIPPRLLRFHILPPGLVPVSSIILVDSPAMTGNLVKAIIVGGIDHVSSLQLQDWLGFYIVCLLTFIAFVMRPRYVLVV